METPFDVLEHFVPVNQGGGTTPGNCLPSCTPCNGRKRDRRPEELADAFDPERVETLMEYLKERSTGADVGTRVGMQIALRVPDELAEAIDREAERLSKERPGAMIHRSDVVREILHRALMNEPKKGK